MFLSWSAAHTGRHRSAAQWAARARRGKRRSGRGRGVARAGRAGLGWAGLGGACRLAGVQAGPPRTELLIAKVDVGDRAHVHLRELPLALQSVPLALKHIERLVLRSTHARIRVRRGRRRSHSRAALTMPIFSSTFRMKSSSTSGRRVMADRGAASTGATGRPSSRVFIVFKACSRSSSSAASSPKPSSSSSSTTTSV